MEFACRHSVLAHIKEVGYIFSTFGVPEEEEYAAGDGAESSDLSSWYSDGIMEEDEQQGLE